MCEILCLRYRNGAGNVRRIRLLESGRHGTDYVRVEEEWSGCEWRGVGSEPVTDVELEASSDLVAGVQP